MVSSFNKFCQKYQANPGRPDGTPQGSQEPVVVKLPEDDAIDRFAFRDHLDQGLGGGFELLPPSILAWVRHQHQLITVAPVSEQRRPTDEQISALVRRL